MGARIANLSTEWIVAIIAVLAILRLGLWWAARHQKLFSKETAKAAGELIESALIAVVLVFGLIRPFIVQAFYIPSVSMEPTLLVGDRLLVNKFVYRFGDPRKGDVIVFRAPEQADPEQKDFIKRVVGVGGDVITLENGQIYINGRLDTEPYVKHPDYTAYGTWNVPEGKLFVMGDNRSNSNDSHQWGYLDRNRVVGKAFLIFWPPGRVRVIH